MIVSLSSLFLSGLSFTGSSMKKSLFFSFYGKDGEDRTRDLTVYNLKSSLRRHCKEEDKKCYVTIFTTSFRLLNSFFHHTDKWGPLVRNDIGWDPGMNMRSRYVCLKMCTLFIST